MSNGGNQRVIAEDLPILDFEKPVEYLLLWLASNYRLLARFHGECVILYSQIFVWHRN